MADAAGFHRFEQVSGHIPSTDKLYRSSAPYYVDQDSDQRLTDASISFLRSKSITHVISLNSQADNADIKKKLQDAGIAYTPRPVEDFHAPTREDLRVGAQEFRKHRTGTLVWCGYGHGRTGTMINGLQIYAEQDKAQPARLSHADYEKNHVEQYHNGKSTGQFEVLDQLQG